jgi:multidrug efflux pump subunit AcrB
MTSFAFILGVVPLYIASGAGAASKQSVGTVVLAGMITATILSVLLVPALYVIVQRWSEKMSGKSAAPPAPPAPAAQEASA